MTNKDDKAKLVAIAHADNTTRPGLIREYWRDFDRAERTPRGFAYYHMGLLEGMLANAEGRFQKATDTLLRIRLALGAGPDDDLVAVIDSVNQRLSVIETRLRAR